MRIAPHSRVRAERVTEYEQAHREVPTEPTGAIRRADTASRTVWRSGPDLFHPVECEDYAALIARLSIDPVDVA